MAWEFPRTAIAPKDANGFKRWDSGLYREQYQIKHDIALELNPKSILEIGVRAGYSAFAFLSACPTARYVGLDAENNKHGGQGGPWTPWAVEILKPYDARIEIGDTQKMTELARFGGFELIHVDGDHTTAGCLHDLEMALEVLLPGGAILVDDYRYIGSVRKAVDAFAKESGMEMELRDSPRGEAILRRRKHVDKGTGDFRWEPADSEGQGRGGGEGDHHAGPGQEGEGVRDGGAGCGEDERRFPGAVHKGGSGEVQPAHGRELLQCRGGRRDLLAHPKPLGVGERVTLIISSRDENGEVVRTCQSALDAATGPVEIIVIDDGSKRPAKVPEGVRLHREIKPLGLFAAKRLAVGMAKTENIVISDAHVRFHPGWDEEYQHAIGAKPDAVHVALSSGLMEEKGVIPELAKAKGTYYGANFVVRRKADKKGLRILEGVWQHKRQEGPIPCPMGSVYGTSKSWWEHVDMLAGLQVWGGQEPDMAMRTWLAGGEVRLLPSVKTAHVFKTKAPYPSDVGAIHQNRMLMATVFPPQDVAEALLNELAKNHRNAAKRFDFPAAVAARERFDKIRVAGSWEAWLERFPEIHYEPAVL